jgi:hypothetical protein
MAMEGLLALVCAGAIIGSNPATPAPSEDSETSLAVILSVQTAMQQGREFLLRNNPRMAVEVLESQLSRINGNPMYLGLLRDAYRAYIKELRLTKQEERAQMITRRLQILDPVAHGDNQPAAVAAATQTKPGTAVGAAPASKAAIVRGYRQDEDPFQQPHLSSESPAKALLAQADKEFGQNHFHDADLFYQQANQADAQATKTSRDRWAYCKMHDVVDLLNRQSTSFGSMESEVTAALGLGPAQKIEAYGRQLLTEIDKRKRNQASVSVAAATTTPQAVNVRNLGQTADGWSVAETANFRIYHHLSSDWVEQVARTVEETRTRMQQKWLRASASGWNAKCELYLHSTGQDYSRLTGVSAASPGHSSFQLEGGRVLGRRMDLHCDDPGMLGAVLPHETTHVVLAGNFGDHPVPRWVDEGIAVLSEPREKIDRHLRNLPRHRQQGELFPLRQLIQMSDYPPEPHRVGAFYAESVSVVDFLSRQRGPEVFTQFIREGMQSGFERAVQKYYGCRSFEDLESQWVAFAFAGSDTGVAQAPP